MKVLAATAAAVLLLLLVLWRPWESPPSVTPAEARESPPRDTVPASADSPPVPTPPAPPAETAPTPPRVSPEEVQRVLAAIDSLDLTFRDHATALGGNPVGTNAEITAALRGDNAKQLKLEIPEGSTLNDRGELCDPWGTPWFFHQLSGTRMEIRSAGADRLLHSDDDFVR